MSTQATESGPKSFTSGVLGSGLPALLLLEKRNVESKNANDIANRDIIKCVVTSPLFSMEGYLPRGPTAVVVVSLEPNAVAST